MKNLLFQRPLPGRAKALTICGGAMMVGTLLAAMPHSAHAQAFGADFSGLYSMVNLGAAPGVATSYGGITISATNSNTLLLGANANNGAATIDSIGVTRSLINGANRITGFLGTAAVVSTAAGIGGNGGIDGGLAYAPNKDLFYTSYSDNSLGEIKPGSSAPDKQIDLTALGVASSTGGLQFVPSGLPNAGALWISSYNTGELYQTTLVADGSGTYNLSGLTDLGNIGDGPEGITFVAAGNPGFTSPSILVSDYGAGGVIAYTLDASGHPIVGSARNFITGFNGAEGGTVDATTGDFLFSTFGGAGGVIAVRGFAATASAAAPEPGDLALIVAGLPILTGLAMRRRRRKLLA